MSVTLRKLGARLVVAIVLAECALLFYTGLTKAGDVTEFGELLSDHELLPQSWTLGAAWSVILAELLVASVALSALALGSNGRAVVSPLSMLFGAFGLYATALVVFPPPEPTPCGCGLGATSGMGADWSSIALQNFGVASLTALGGPLLRAARSSPGPIVSSGRPQERSAGPS